MYRLTFALCLCAASFTLLATILAQDAKSDVLKLTATRVEKAPELKAELTDTWKAATKLEVGTHYGASAEGPKVELRALHDGEYIYVMARWADETKSYTKSAWEYKEGKWQTAKGDEDRVAIAINGNAPDFETKGCTTLCHYGAMGTGDEKYKADLWHWKAARGGQHGYADDQNFTGADTGRVDDAGKSAYESNANSDKTAPKWVWADKADRGGVFGADTTVELPADFKPEDGYSVPSIRFRKPDASRGDIESAAEHKNGWWTVVLKRKLDTGNADDSVIKIGESAHIAVAVLDNSGVKTGKEHAKSGAIELVVAK